MTGSAGSEPARSQPAAGPTSPRRPRTSGRTTAATAVDLPGDDSLDLGYDPFGRGAWRRDALGRETELDLDAGAQGGRSARVTGQTAWPAPGLTNRADQANIERGRAVLPGEVVELATTAYAYDPADDRARPADLDHRPEGRRDPRSPTTPRPGRRPGVLRNGNPGVDPLSGVGWSQR